MITCKLTKENVMLHLVLFGFFVYNIIEIIITRDVDF